jgi:exodeoxyribonuclease V beta subunit
LEELSELERPQSSFPKAPEPNTTPGTMFDFPRGANAGTFLHDLLEWAAQRGFDRVAREATLRRDHLSRVLANQQWDMWLETLDHWLQAFLSTDLPLGDTTLRLCDLRSEHCVAEMEFWLELNSLWTGKLDRRVQRDTLERCSRPSLENEQWNGMLKGFIDLIFRHKERYYIIDWKSNDLGSRAVDYDNRALRSAIAAKRYDMQYVLYTVALHRHLRHRLPSYDYERNIGGAAYCFLRGLDHPQTRGVHFERPPLRLIQELDRWFQGEGGDVNDDAVRALPAANTITPSSGDRS